MTRWIVVAGCGALLASCAPIALTDRCGALGAVYSGCPGTGGSDEDRPFARREVAARPAPDRPVPGPAAGDPTDQSGGTAQPATSGTNPPGDSGSVATPSDGGDGQGSGGQGGGGQGGGGHGGWHGGWHGGGQGGGQDGGQGGGQGG